MVSKFGARHTLAAMGFFGILNVYFSRIDMSIAVVAMVGRESVIKNDGSNSSLCEAESISEGNTTVTEAPVKGEFDWGPGAKGDLLGGYYYGYIVTQIAGAYLSSRIGFKLTWGISSLISSALTLLIPVVAREGGFAPLLTLRVLIGLFHGVAFPSMHAAWSVWAPPLERSQLVSAHVSGAAAGTCIIFPLGGILASSFGWPAVFYFTGTCNFVWALTWLLLVHDTPEEHPRISKEEKEYITREISAYQSEGSRKGDNDEEEASTSSTSNSSKNIPWKSILTSPVVMSVSAAHFTSNWGNYQMNTLLPTYMDSVLQFNLASNGILSAVPYILQTIICFTTGWISDLIISRNLLRTITVRKINTTLGNLLPAITVVLAGYMGCNAEAAVFMFALSIGFNGMTWAGSKSSMLDFAPKYSGSIMGVSNTISNISGFLAPQVTGHLLDANNSLEQWQLAFWLSAAIYMPGFILFLIFGTDQLLPWAN